jgi:(S)-citramalyl-CoA lyase
VLEANEQGAAIVDGRMVDEAIAREARGVLAAA